LGETRFDTELEILQQEKEVLEKELGRYRQLQKNAGAEDRKEYDEIIKAKQAELTALKASGPEKQKLEDEIKQYRALHRNAGAEDKRVYEEMIRAKEKELSALNEAQNVLVHVGATHYIEGVSDASFSERPLAHPNRNLHTALETVTMLKGKQVGKEIAAKRADQIKELRDELSEVRFNTKQLLKRGLPQEVKDDLHNTTTFLESALQSHITGEVNIPDRDDLIRMRGTVRSILDGTALERPEPKTPRGPKEALASIAADGNDITVASLVQYGMLEEDAENLYELLVREGVIQP